MTSSLGVCKGVGVGLGLGEGFGVGRGAGVCGGPSRFVMALKPVWVLASSSTYPRTSFDVTSSVAWSETSGMGMVCMLRSPSEPGVEAEMGTGAAFASEMPCLCRSSMTSWACW